MPTHGLNFDTLLTCDSDYKRSVTHLNISRYSNTKSVKNTSQNGSKLTLSQNSLTPTRLRQLWQIRDEEERHSCSSVQLWQILQWASIRACSWVLIVGIEPGF